MQIDAKFAWPFLARVPDCHHEKIYAIIIKKSLKIRTKNQIFEILTVLLLFLTVAFCIFIILKKCFENIGELLVNVKKAGT